MYNDQEEKIRAVAAGQASQSQGGMLGKCDMPRIHLRDRVGERLRQAARQASKAVSLNELARLLDKNPDVATILTLMEEL